MRLHGLPWLVQESCLLWRMEDQFDPGMESSSFSASVLFAFVFMVLCKHGKINS